MFQWGDSEEDLPTRGGRRTGQPVPHVELTL